MPAPRVYRTEAIVLHGYNYAEADRILALYTPTLGKVRAIAKGVRKTKSRKSGHLDLFIRSNLLIARGRQLDIVTQAETIENFRGLREDLWRTSYAHYVAELTDRFTPEALPSQPLYDLLAATLRRLAGTADLQLTVRWFEVQLLTITGYRPQLQRCLQCDSPIIPQSNAFSARLGGVLCPNCSFMDKAAPAISVPALKLLRNLQSNEEATLQVSGVPGDVHAEVERRLQEYVAYLLEARPRSTGFLERLRAEASGA